MWRNDVYNLWCFVALNCCKIIFFWQLTLFCREFVVAIYALLCGEKLSQKLCLWREKDKYNVCQRRPYSGPTCTKNVMDFLVSLKKLAGQTQKLYFFLKHFPFVWQEKHGRGNPPCLCAGDGLQCGGEIRVSQW